MVRARCVPPRTARRHVDRGRLGVDERLERGGPAQVEVGVVLPGEADASVHLDVEVGAQVGRLQREHGRHRRGVRALVAAFGGRPGRVPHVGRGQLAGHEHVGAVVLDRFEHCDGPAELQAHLGVGGGLLRAFGGHPDGLRRQDQSSQVVERTRSARR